MKRKWKVGGSNEIRCYELIDGKQIKREKDNT